jgi:hypothetical protein
MSNILTYFKPKHMKLLRDDVMLNWCVLVGTMQSGKTTTAKTLINLINMRYGEEYPTINLETKYINDVFKIHEDPGLVGQLIEAELINVFIDDAVTGASSKRYNWQTETNWFRIRHYFHEDLGVKRATLNVFFATQRYMNLQNILRSAPLLIFKALPATDISEKQLLGALLGQGKWRILNQWAHEIFVKGKINTMSWNMIKILNERTYIQEILPDLGDIVFYKLKHGAKGKQAPESDVKAFLVEEADNVVGVNGGELYRRYVDWCRRLSREPVPQPEFLREYLSM